MTCGGGTNNTTEERVSEHRQPHFDEEGCCDCQCVECVIPNSSRCTCDGCNVTECGMHFEPIDEDETPTPDHEHIALDEAVFHAYQEIAIAARHLNPPGISMRMALDKLDAALAFNEAQPPHPPAPMRFASGSVDSDGEPT